MDDRVSALLARLDAIAASLARNEHGLALIGLGSVGTDRGRLDAHSDLDFFAIVERHYKHAFIADLTWLEEAAPIAFSFQNTRDGHKVLFTDGIYAEFAVFEPDELAAIPIEGGRVVWEAEGPGVPILTWQAPAPHVPPSVEFLLGEILTNLYVGLTRLRRGERLSAVRSIQGHAVDRLLELCPLVEPALPVTPDRFDGARRFEHRFPLSAQHLPHFVQGYDHSADAALAILDFLEARFPINEALKHRILEAVRAIDAGEQEAESRNEASSAP